MAQAGTSDVFVLLLFLKSMGSSWSCFFRLFFLQLCHCRNWASTLHGLQTSSSGCLIVLWNKYLGIPPCFVFFLSFVCFFLMRLQFLSCYFLLPLICVFMLLKSMQSLINFCLVFPDNFVSWLGCSIYTAGQVALQGEQRPLLIQVQGGLNSGLRFLQKSVQILWTYSRNMQAE